jgi:MarR family transcriptional regulator for hemolysin
MASGPPAATPIGLELATAARRVGQAFDGALAAVGGSRSTWLILLTIKSRSFASQHEIAEAVGIRGATLTYHLNAMEKAGLLTRHRDQDNRRVHVVELTDAGETAFEEMRDAAAQFDRRLRRRLDDAQIAELQRMLNVLSENVVVSPGRS